MKNVIMLIHGGAGPDSEFIRKNMDKIEAGLEEAVEAGYKVLYNKGSAVDAVEAAVRTLEDNIYFNAGRGSAINAKGEVEMCASIMDGKENNAGAVALVKNVKNPVTLAKSVMTQTPHIYLGGNGAMEYAKESGADLEPESYFVTVEQFDKYTEKRKKSKETGMKVGKEQMENRYHGTVGAVAVDYKGNVAAATSTGGTEFCREGRIADSSMIGVGTYANNDTCAISCTGDGEYLMRGVIAHAVSGLMKYQNKNLQEACREVLYKENAGVKGDIGVIAVDKDGNFAVEFNSERMHRAIRTSEGTQVKIYKEAR